MIVTRRSFVLAGAGVTVAEIGVSAAPPALRFQRPLTAGDVIDRIKANVGMPWLAQTVDTIISGAPETRVKGIATTMMATLDVVERAAAAGRNLVITHEPTFYSHQDTTDTQLQDPTYRHKAEFLRSHARRGRRRRSSSWDTSCPSRRA